MPIHERLIRPFSILLFSSVVSTAHAGPDAFLDLDVNAGLDDNVSRAQEDLDIDYDTFVSAKGTLGTTLYRGRSGHINGRVGLGVSQFMEYDGLSNLSFTVGADYIFGFSSGFGAPWYAVNATYSFKEFDSFLRDSDIYVLGFTMGKRFDDLTNIRTAINYKLRESDGVAFDTEDISWFVNVDWTVYDRTTLYTTYKLQAGDVFSTASNTTLGLSGPGTLGVILGSGAIPKETDDVFDDSVTYRLDSTTHILTFGLNYAETLHNAYDVTFRYLKSDTDVGLVYEDLMIRFSYFHKFGIDF